MASRLWEKLVALKGFSAKSAKSAALNPEKPPLGDEATSSSDDVQCLKPGEEPPCRSLS
jgi:hypothetical protein